VWLQTLLLLLVLAVTVLPLIMPRHADPVWDNFWRVTKDGNKGRWAKCKKCKTEMQGIPSWLKYHYDICWAETESSAADEGSVAVLGDLGESVSPMDDDETSQIGQSQPAHVVTTVAEIHEHPSVIFDDHELSSSSSTSTGVTKSAPINTDKQPKCPKPKPLKQQSLAVATDYGIVSTSDAYAEQLATQIGRYFFATNTPFSHVDHAEFHKLCKLLRPGYKPISQRQLGGKILDKVYDSEIATCGKILSGEVVSMCLDGWSNVHNDPLVCCSVIRSNGDTYLVDTIDTSGFPHTADYLADVAKHAVNTIKENFGAIVRTIVTDNAANVAKMRQILQQQGEEDNQNGAIITYGCSAHMLNLLSADVEVSGVKDEIVSIAKYFRNRHLPAAWFKAAGGSKLTLPIDVRWNTVCDAIQSFLKNRGILVQICQDHKDSIDRTISNLVNDAAFAAKAKTYMELMMPISVALDRAQRSGTTIAVSVEIWHKLGLDLLEQATSVMKLFESRRDKALTGAHYLANVIDNRFRGRNLSNIQKKCAYDFLSSFHADLLPYVMACDCADEPFATYLFDAGVLRVSPMTWWKVASRCITKPDLQKRMLSLCTQLLTAVASTAGLERIFSTFGLVQSKLRNRLGNDKAGKLTFLVRALNQKESWEDFDDMLPSSSSGCDSTHNLHWVAQGGQIS